MTIPRMIRPMIVMILIRACKIASVSAATHPSQVLHTYKPELGLAVPFGTSEAAITLRQLVLAGFNGPTHLIRMTTTRKMVIHTALLISAVQSVSQKVSVCTAGASHQTHS